MLPAACLALLLSASIVPSPAVAQGTCGPSPLGAPCEQGGLAVSPATEPQINLGAGNPIHLVTGNKYQQETDLPANPDAPGIEVVRHYNAMDLRVSPLGQGWHLSYDTRLYAIGGRWQIVQADGSRITFTGASGTPLPHARGVLSFDGVRWRWTWPDGRQLHFNAAGHLVRIRAPGRYDIAIQRHTDPGPLNGSIETVINDRGQTLHFHYRLLGNQALLDYIDTPLGRYSYR
ncbi:MAG TPA: DUF6531 domain-containing protein, partial [Burkholderiaceae bacterium]|nr:DUF6531 domain-containing protein [Burkholderiaceae bacterium]